MPENDPSAAPEKREDNQIDDPALLSDVQAYLHLRAQGSEPAPVLTHAWGEFFSLYDKVLRAYAGGFHLPDQASAELVLDVWEDIVVKLPHFVLRPDGTGFRSWLFHLARGKFLDERRKRARHPEEDVAAMVANEAEPCVCKLNPAVLFQHREARAFVARLLEQLRQRISAADFRIFQMRWLEQSTIEEIARIFPWPPATIRKHLSRAFLRLS